jgi:hypothetical protein
VLLFIQLWSLGAGLPAADKPPDTLAARIGGFQHVGVTIAPDTGFVTLRLYTAKQQEGNVKAVADARKEQAAYADQASQLQALIEVAQGEERTRLRTQLEQLRTARSNVAFRQRPFSTTFYTLLSVGEDYLELQSTDGKEAISLMPLRLVSRVYLPEKEAVEEPAKAEPKAEPKP